MPREALRRPRLASVRRGAARAGDQVACPTASSSSLRRCTRPLQRAALRCAAPCPALTLESGEKLSGSRAIMRRLEELAPSPPLLPADPGGARRGRARPRSGATRSGSRWRGACCGRPFAVAPAARCRATRRARAARCPRPRCARWRRWSTRVERRLNGADERRRARRPARAARPPRPHRRLAAPTACSAASGPTPPTCRSPRPRGCMLTIGDVRRVLAGRPARGRSAHGAVGCGPSRAGAVPAGALPGSAGATTCARPRLRPPARARSRTKPRMRPREPSGASSADERARAGDRREARAEDAAARRCPSSRLKNVVLAPGDERRDLQRRQARARRRASSPCRSRAEGDGVAADAGVVEERLDPARR